MVKELPALNSESKPQYLSMATTTQKVVTLQGKEAGAGSAECLPRQLMASSPRSAMVEGKQGKWKLPGEELGGLKPGAVGH